MAPQRPLGFWLKLLDQLINEQFDAILEEHGVTRRQWQVLTMLSTNPATRAELRDALAPFLTGAEPEPLDEELVDLIESDWVAESGEAVVLTDRGRTAFGRLSEVVGRTRQTLAAGVSPDEYDQTLAVLERMARNLGWTDPVET
jgi:DNA-binding MarR family transcriptional regulator